MTSDLDFAGDRKYTYVKKVFFYDLLNRDYHRQFKPSLHTLTFPLAHWGTLIFIGQL